MINTQHVILKADSAKIVWVLAWQIFFLFMSNSCVQDNIGICQYGSPSIWALELLDKNKNTGWHWVTSKSRCIFFY